MKKSILLVLFLNFLFSSGQNKDSFQEGLNNGFNETLTSKGYYILTQRVSPDNKKCDVATTYYSTDNNIKSKEYTRGYRCGVEQAIINIELEKQKITAKKQEANNSLKVDYSQLTETDKVFNEIIKESSNTSIKINSLNNNDRKPIDYGETISLFEPKQKNVESYSNYQKIYDYNNNRINDALKDIKIKISNLDYPIEIMNNLNSDFESYINDLNIHFSRNKNDILSNAAVTNLINYLYYSVSNSIQKRVQEYNLNLKKANISEEVIDVESANEFLKRHKGGYNVKIIEYEFVKNEWKMIKEEISKLYVDLQYIAFYSNSLKKWQFRELIFNKYDKGKELIVFSSQYGNTNFDIKLHNIIFENIINKESNSNSKYFIYEILSKDSTIDPYK